VCTECQSPREPPDLSILHMPHAFSRVPGDARPCECCICTSDTDPAPLPLLLSIDTTLLRRPTPHDVSCTRGSLGGSQLLSKMEGSLNWARTVDEVDKHFVILHRNHHGVPPFVVLEYLHSVALEQPLLHRYRQRPPGVTVKRVLLFC
jgi:hypothetical protein